MTADTPKEKQSWLDAFNNIRRTQELANAAPRWESDKEGANCRICNTGFTAIKRRHHCRKCGLLVCGGCSNNTVFLQTLQRYSRVCDTCYKEMGGSTIKKGSKIWRSPESFTERAPVSARVAEGRLRVHSLERKFLMTILEYLDPKSLCMISETGKFWNELTNDDFLWKALGEKLWTEFDVVSKQTWRQSFAIKARTETNWRTYSYTTFELTSHEAAVGALVSKNNRAVSGGDDKTLCLWNTQKSSLIAKYTGHEDSIRCLFFTKKYVASGSNDKTVRIWHREPLTKFDKSLVGHSKSVTGVQFDSKIVVSSSEDGTIKVWDFESGKCLRTFLGHKGPVTCLRFEGRQLVTGGADGTLKLWNIRDPKKTTCRGTIRVHEKSVTCLDFVRDRLVSGCEDGTVNYWSLERSCKLVGHTKAVTGIAVHEGRVITGSGDGSIIIWDEKSGLPSRKFDNGGFGGVKCLAVADARMIASYENSLVLKGWDFSSKHKRKVPRSRKQSVAQSTASPPVYSGLAGHLSKKASRSNGDDKYNTVL